MAGSEPRLVKTSGLVEPFREGKLRRSLRRSGASRAQIEAVVDAVRQRLHDGMRTRDVYRIAHRWLRSERRDTAARYSLRHAILELGPDGFPFERFVAELLRHDGWRTRTGVVLQGRFVRHEVDIDATRGTERLLGECKFKAQRDGKVDVKVALYVHARAEDLQAVPHDEFWLITNGGFTKDAIAYGEGTGLHLLGWDHPRGDGLRERIDAAGLHPVTVLTSLQRREQQHLLQQGVVLCAELQRRPRLIEDLRLPQRREEQLRLEVAGLCQGPVRPVASAGHNR